jgi:beta-lactamase regulating signal transducer with metallopeptidase domain
MLWQVGVLVGIVWIADAAIRRWAWPQVRYALWMLVLLKLLIPPTLTSPVLRHRFPKRRKRSSASGLIRPPNQLRLFFHLKM